MIPHEVGVPSHTLRVQVTYPSDGVSNKSTHRAEPTMSGVERLSGCSQSPKVEGGHRAFRCEDRSQIRMQDVSYYALQAGPQIH